MAGVPSVFAGAVSVEALQANGAIRCLSLPDEDHPLAAGAAGCFVTGNRLGDRSFEQDSRGDSMFVILEGTVRIDHGGRARNALGPGEFFGAMAVGRPRHANGSGGRAGRRHPVRSSRPRAPQRPRASTTRVPADRDAGAVATTGTRARLQRVGCGDPCG